MQAQLDARRRRIDAGERPLGWKVGFGAPAAMTALDIRQGLVGYLMQSGIMASGSELKYSDFTKPAIEPEIAVYLVRDLDGDSDEATIEAAISALGPAIERGSTQLLRELEAEEKRLTELRAETSPEEFRDMADAFDAKVQEIRRDSERRVVDLERDRERLPIQFLRAVEPVLSEVMREAGGTVVLDARTVLFRTDAVDVTETAIARIDLRRREADDDIPF